MYNPLTYIIQKHNIKNKPKNNMKRRKRKSPVKKSRNIFNKLVEEKFSKLKEIHMYKNHTKPLIVCTRKETLLGIQ